MKKQAISKINQLLFVLILIIPFKNYSQDTIIVFKDYASFVNKSGETYNEMLGFSYAIKMNILVKKNGTEFKIKCKNIWGFLYNGHLFRTDTRTGQVAELILKGKICYYENGPGHLSMIRDKKDKAEFGIGYYCYVSKNLETKLAPFPSPYVTFSDAHKQLRKFKKANPEYKDLFEKMHGNYEYTAVRSRIIEYEKK